MPQVGCRPYWLPSTLFLSTEADNCTKASQLDQFLGLMAKVEEIPNEKALFEEYKCLRPCRFMEYKVDSSKEVCADYEIMKKTLFT